jgi:hypothetical protein
MNWRWWKRGDPELGLLGFVTKKDRDAFHDGGNGPFKRVVADDGRTILQGENFHQMVRRLAYDTMKELSEKDKEQIVFAAERYTAALHGVQSGIATMIGAGDDLATPKHLRVGVDARASDAMGLAKLLMAKGVFTEVEYHVAIADAMEAEKARLEAVLSERYGTKITLA